MNYDGWRAIKQADGQDSVDDDVLTNSTRSFQNPNQMSQQTVGIFHLADDWAFFSPRKVIDLIYAS